MKYLLDTNICIHYFKGQFGIKERIEKIGFENFAISEITLAELIYGAEKSQQTKRNMNVVDSFAKKIEILPILSSLKVYGKEKARLKSIGKIIGDLDLFIGSTAIVNDMTMVTRNTREFERINGIEIENWIDE
ncbi:MAG: type II toxin-antitoxin system VapC family toxin [Bacteroidetes bacterium]|nr:MAG: type II toxin-antitoxin system VapC family toxin [Bacteroidota bacterium]